MAVEDSQRAKEIFFHYACNHFFLDREVDVKEYEKFNISREQEHRWRQEYIFHWVSQLSVADFQAVDKLDAANAGEALREMIGMSELGDSFAKLRYANALWNIASGSVMFSIARARAKRKAVLLWKSLLKNRVELTDDHRKHISQIIEDQARVQKSVRAVTPEDYILNYARNKLTEAEEKRFLFLSLVSGVIKIIFVDLAHKVKKLGKRSGLRS